MGVGDGPHPVRASTTMTYRVTQASVLNIYDYSRAGKLTGSSSRQLSGHSYSNMRENKNGPDLLAAIVDNSSGPVGNNSR